MTFAGAVTGGQDCRSVHFLQWEQGAYPVGGFECGLDEGSYFILGHLAEDPGPYDGASIYVDGEEMGSWGPEFDEDNGGQVDAVIITVVDAGSHTVELQQRDAGGSHIPHDPTQHGAVVIIPTELLRAVAWPSHKGDFAGTEGMTQVSVPTAAGEPIMPLAVAIGNMALPRLDGSDLPPTLPFVEVAQMWGIVPGGGTHVVGTDVNGTGWADGAHGATAVFQPSRLASCGLTMDYLSSLYGSFVGSRSVTVGDGERLILIGTIAYDSAYARFMVDGTPLGQYISTPGTRLAMESPSLVAGSHTIRLVTNQDTSLPEGETPYGEPGFDLSFIVLHVPVAIFAGQSA